MFQVNQDGMNFDSSTLESAVLVPIDATTNEYGVQLKLKKDAAIKLISSQNIGKQSHLTLNGKLISSPTIQGELGAELVVMGLTREQAEKFVQGIAGR